MFEGIDLYSDTLTKPCDAMRRAIAEAMVGDEQKQEDPTTNALQEYAASLLKHDMALFLPSSTMANQIAIMLHCEVGDQLFAASNSHIICFEVGGPSVHAGAMSIGIESDNGIFFPQDIENKLLPDLPHCPRSRLICVENTSNMGGGVPWTLAELDTMKAFASKHALRLHMDGARLMNAAIALKQVPSKLVEGFDTVTMCLSKGLGCPIGALLIGKKEHIVRARRYKHLFGGAMRQSGMMAAAGLYALQNNIERLADDHQNAQLLAQGLAEIEGIEVRDQAPPTNMVFFKIAKAGVAMKDFLDTCEANGLRFSGGRGGYIRAVTHLDINQTSIEQAISITKEVLSMH